MKQNITLTAIPLNSLISIQQSDLHPLNHNRLVQRKNMNILYRELQTLLDQTCSHLDVHVCMGKVTKLAILETWKKCYIHLTAEDSVFEVSVQPLIMVRVKVGEKVDRATRNGTVLKCIHHHICFCSVKSMSYC